MFVKTNLKFSPKPRVTLQSELLGDNFPFRYKEYDLGSSKGRERDEEQRNEGLSRVLLIGALRYKARKGIKIEVFIIYYYNIINQTGHQMVPWSSGQDIGL